MTFTIGTPDATTGEVEFIPDSPVILAAVGSGAMASCTINFFVDVLMAPTKDAMDSPGLQTDQLGRVRAEASVNMVTGSGTGSGFTTLLVPTPTPTTTPTATPTDTPTATPQPTRTRGPLGNPCFEAGDCASECCCDLECQPVESCFMGICNTPTPTGTVTPTPTMTPGPNDCCECSDAAHTCSQPTAGQCNLICPDGTPPAIVLDSTCVGPPPTTTGIPSTPASGGCATKTPTPSPTATGTPKCLGNGPGGNEDLIPGYCGPLKQDCVSEICMFPQGPRLPNGLPDNHVTCKRDDPICDAVLGDNACTFSFRICFNLIDVEDRFRCIAAGPITNVWLHVPLESAPKTQVDAENVDAFEAALMKLGGVIGGFRKRSVSFSPPLADTVCTDFIQFKVLLGQNPNTLAFRARKRRVNWHAYRTAGEFDGDHLFLKCVP